MVTASITFTQSAVSPGPGISMVGVGGAVVTLTNADDTGVVDWAWELLDSPLNSALVPGLLGPTASETFTPDTPDTPGCYRIKLTVQGADGSVACDVKNFAVPTTQGWILPPFKATAAELNFPGNDEGWESLLNTIFLSLSSGGSSGPQTIIAYRPGVPSSGNSFATWAEIMAIIAVNEAVRVMVDTSATPGTPAPVPAGVFDMRFADLASVSWVSGLVVLELDPATELQNVRAIRDGLELRCNPNVGPALTFPATAGAVQVLAVSYGAILSNYGSVPAVEVTTTLLAVSTSLTAQMGGGASTAPIVNVTGGTVLVSDNIGFWDPNWLSGDAGSTVQYYGLSPSFPDPVPAIPLFLGTVVFGPNNGNLAIAPRIHYTPAVPANWPTVPTTVQQALDGLASSSGSSIIVYRPGVPSSGNAFATWAEIMGVISKQINTRIMVDTLNTPGVPAPVPAGVYDMRFADLFSNGYGPGSTILYLDPAAELQNVKTIHDSLRVQCNSTTTPALTFPATAGGIQGLGVFHGAEIDNQGTVPAIEVNGTQFLIVAQQFGSVGVGACPTPIINAINGGVVIVVDTFGNWCPNWLAGDVTTTLIYNLLGPSFPDPLPAIPLFLGGWMFGVGNYATSRRISFIPSVSANWLSTPATDQDGLDGLAERPNSAHFVGIKGVLPIGNRFALADLTGNVANIMPYVCTSTCLVHNLRAHLGTAPGVGASTQVTVNLNGAPTAIICAVVGASTNGNDSVNAVGAVAGDLISFDVLNSAGSVAADLSVTLEIG